jgi:hypothetical protein
VANPSCPLVYLASERNSRSGTVFTVLAEKAGFGVAFLNLSVPNLRLRPKTELRASQRAYAHTDDPLNLIKLRASVTRDY